MVGPWTDPTSSRHNQTPRIGTNTGPPAGPAGPVHARKVAAASRMEWARLSH